MKVDCWPDTPGIPPLRCMPRCVLFMLLCCWGIDFYNNFDLHTELYENPYPIVSTLHSNFPTPRTPTCLGGRDAIFLIICTWMALYVDGSTTPECQGQCSATAPGTWNAKGTARQGLLGFVVCVMFSCLSRVFTFSTSPPSPYRACLAPLVPHAPPSPRPCAVHLRVVPAAHLRVWCPPQLTPGFPLAFSPP